MQVESAYPDFFRETAFPGIAAGSIPICKQRSKEESLAKRHSAARIKAVRTYPASPSEQSSGNQIATLGHFVKCCKLGRRIQACSFAGHPPITGDPRPPIHTRETRSHELHHLPHYEEANSVADSHYLRKSNPSQAWSLRLEPLPYP